MKSKVSLMILRLHRYAFIGEVARRGIVTEILASSNPLAEKVASLDPPSLHAFTIDPIGRGMLVNFQLSKRWSLRNGCVMLGPGSWSQIMTIGVPILTEAKSGHSQLPFDQRCRYAPIPIRNPNAKWLWAAWLSWYAY
jgi:hypothetical protein